MGTIDKFAFEHAGARGCSNSDYKLCRTTCCRAWCAEDVELSDLYVDGRDTSKVVSLLMSVGDSSSCPFCGADPWDFKAVEDTSAVPQEWRWALSAAK